MIELKNCPFCGGDATIDFNENKKARIWFTFIKCKTCNAQGKSFVIGEYEELSEAKVKDTVTRAAEAWNRRA